MNVVKITRVRPNVVPQLGSAVVELKEVVWIGEVVVLGMMSLVGHPLSLLARGFGI